MNKMNVIFILILIIVSLNLGFSSVDRICAEGYLEGDKINLKVLAERLGVPTNTSLKNGEEFVLLNDSVYDGWYGKDSWWRDVNQNNLKSDYYTSCGKYKMYGGYNKFGWRAYIEKKIDYLPPGLYEISFNFYAGDSWDNEYGRLYINGNLVWNRRYVYDGRNNGLNVCGRSDYSEANNFEYRSYNVVRFRHPGGPLVIRFTSTLNGWPNNDEFWGINNVKLKLIFLDKLYSDHIEFFYTPKYNYGVFDRVRWNCGPFLVKVYYDNSIQICSTAKLDTANSLSAGACSAVYLLYPYMVGSWNSLDSKTYIEKMLEDVARNEIYLKGGYNVLLTNSYITGMKNKYITLFATRGRDGLFSFECNLNNNSYIVKEGNSGSGVQGDPGDHTDYYVDGNKIFMDDAHNWNDGSLFNFYIPKGHNKIRINYYYDTCHCCCCDCPTYLYFGSVLFENDKTFLGNCSILNSGMAWDRHDIFMSGYGIGRAIKTVSSEMIVPGKDINVTLYVDPPSAEYVKIKDYFPKEFGFDGKVKVYRMKLGSPTPLSTKEIIVSPTLDGNDYSFELDGKNIDIMKNLKWNEYLKIEYTLHVPESLSEGNYQLKAANVVYSPMI